MWALTFLPLTFLPLAFLPLTFSSLGFSSLDLFFDNRYSVVVYDRVIRRCAMKKNLLLALRSGEELTLRQQTLLAL